MKMIDTIRALRAAQLFLPELAWNPAETDAFMIGSRVHRVLAHLAAFDGTDSQLLKTTAGALHVTDAQLATLQTALVGAGDKGVDDLLTEALALKLALVGAGDKGLDDVITEAEALKLALVGATDKGLDDLDTSLAALAALITGGALTTVPLTGVKAADIEAGIARPGEAYFDLTTAASRLVKIFGPAAATDETADIYDSDTAGGTNRRRGQVSLDDPLTFHAAGRYIDVQGPNADGTFILNAWNL